MTGSVSRTKFKALESVTGTTSDGTPSSPSKDCEALSSLSSLAKRELLVRLIS